MATDSSTSTTTAQHHDHNDGQTSQISPWVPLESNPEVLNPYLEQLGIKKLEFVDVLSIDDSELLAFIPRPVHALLLVFPVTETYTKYKQEQDKDKELFENDNNNVGGPMWIKQTIPNACGTMGLLHCAANIPPEYIEHDSPLESLLFQLRSLTTSQRTSLLESSKELSSAHATLAQTGQSTAPSAETDTNLHFIALVKAASFAGGVRIWELDGSRKGPIERGIVGANDDLLSETALNVIREFMAREKSSGEVGFGLSALVNKQD